MRMSSLTLALVTTATLSACAAHPRVEGVGPEAPPALRVWIGYPVGSSRVHPIFVNREAHVAMFEIIPGRGVTMVYPNTGADAFASDMHYADLTVQLGRGYYYSDPFGFASFQPRYYYAIASAAPLNIGRLRSSLGATRRILGRMYASYRPYDVIDRLTELVVPMQPDDEWATDLFIDWPVPAPRWSSFASRTIRCANGRVIWAGPNYPYYGCPGDTRLAVVATSAPPPTKKRLPFEPLPRPPRPRDPQQLEELSVGDLENRRRAQPGTRPPRAGGITHAAWEERPRRVSDRGSPGSGGQTASSPTSDAGSSSGSSGRSQPVDQREPRAQPAPDRGESARPRKPQ